MRMLRIVSGVVGSLTVVTLALAQAPAPASKNMPAAQAHVMVMPEDVKWAPMSMQTVEGKPPADFASEAPPQVAVIDGDPSKPAPFTLRLKLAAGARVAPHWHPTDEHVTVLQGTLLVGIGEKYDESAMHALPTGAYAKMPGTVRHFAKATGETVLQVHATGPFKLIFVGEAAASRNPPQN